MLGRSQPNTGRWSMRRRSDGGSSEAQIDTTGHLTTVTAGMGHEIEGSAGVRTNQFEDEMRRTGSGKERKETR